MLYIYNSLTRKKELLKPIQERQIRMYVCGITVYDLCHLGHARMFIVFDVITRYLRSQNYQVVYVRNITDIDDKIIKRSHELQCSWQDLTKKYIDEMHQDEKALNILSPDIEPKATEHVNEMIEMIDKLIANDHAYLAENGDVYYRVQSFQNYGKLSHKDLEGLRSGIRVEVADAKHDPLDFVLWKRAKEGEPSWPSPWGDGRPGWHIECSAMSTKYLGTTFDIHGGGFDLQFPHHENEIAQSEGAHNCSFVNTWIHNGFVQINKEKMSKSLNNFQTIREVLATYHPEVLRYLMIMSHYRSPVSFSEDALEQAKAGLTRLYNAIASLDLSYTEDQQKLNPFIENFHKAMNDDFNTPEALSVLFEMAHEIQKLKTENTLAALKMARSLVKLGNVLGLLFEKPIHFLQGHIEDEFASEIERLIIARNEARKSKNWAEADRIRLELQNRNIVLEDNATGTSWRKMK